MPVTDKQMVLLRAYLAGEPAIVQRVNRQLAGTATADGIAELVSAALVIAARRKFTSSSSRADVIRFVARVRALLAEQPEALDPVAAEYELRTALGEKMTGSPAGEAKARAQVVLLDALVQSANLGDAAVADLLSQARAVADRMLP